MTYRPVVALLIGLAACTGTADTDKGDDSTDADTELDGSDTEGSDTEGTDSEGTDTELDGSDSEGTDSEGTDSEGTDSEGTDSEGTDTEGIDSEGTDSDGTEGDGDGTDTEPASTIEVWEQVWIEAESCWETRTLIRPAEYYTVEGWDLYAVDGYPYCYDVMSADWTGPDDPYAYEVYSTEDGLCSRWPSESVCELLDPWVKPCGDVDGCCDLELANTTFGCPP